MIAVPLFKIKENDAEITEEMCKYLKEKKNCIPEKELDNMVPAMYLNIIEYIDNWILKKIHIYLMKHITFNTY